MLTWHCSGADVAGVCAAAVYREIRAEMDSDPLHKARTHSECAFAPADTASSHFFLSFSLIQIIAFFPTARQTQFAAEALLQMGIPAMEIHSRCAPNQP
jgi:hypothetical protein